MTTEVISAYGYQKLTKLDYLRFQQTNYLLSFGVCDDARVIAGSLFNFKLEINH